MKSILLVFIFLSAVLDAQADLKYYPIDFQISTDQESYYEGEKITFFITIKNTDKKTAYPVLLPHTQNTGQKLFYLNLFDKAKNTQLLRATEDRMLNMMVQEVGSVQIRYLKPQEQIRLSIFLNDFDNQYSYQTQNSSHHSFGVPLFAGVYKVNVCYNPKGIALGDSIYDYYGDFDHSMSNGKLQMHENGLDTKSIELKIKRSADRKVKIEGKTYTVSFDGHRYSYTLDRFGEGGNTSHLVHVSNIPPESYSVEKGEYFYSHFANLYNEYIVRFDDCDIKEYRKYQDGCPDYLYTEEYNAFKQRILFAMQLPDGRFYKISINQPDNTPHQETYCSADGTLCQVTTFKYDSDTGSVQKVVTQTSPCKVVLEDGKKRSVHKLKELSE